MNNRLLKPPMRLILNSRCNGKCKFCHSEGNEKSKEMPECIVEECINAAEKVAITQIALTGGEPTLRNDLSRIINKIKENKKIDVSLTTNGYKLEDISKSLVKPIDKINLSIFSLKKELAEEYQNVDPRRALDALCSVPAINKNLNIVVGEENYLELDKFIKWGIRNSISLDLMFLDRKDQKYKEIQKQIINGLINYFKGGEILLDVTSVLKIEMGEGCILRIKSPFLSGLLHNGLCDVCKINERCFEKICAVRVYPDGVVSPCLSRKICLDGANTYEKIINTYNHLQDMTIAGAFVGK